MDKKIKNMAFVYFALGGLCIPGSLVGPIVVFVNSPEVISDFWFFLLGGMLASLSIAICLIYTGFCWLKESSWGFRRIVSIVLCAFPPFGTILGIFSYRILNEIKQKHMLS